jgi:hypothetical protein
MSFCKKFATKVIAYFKYTSFLFFFLKKAWYLLVNKSGLNLKKISDYFRTIFIKTL